MESGQPFRTIGKYQISTRCMQTYPCQHYVKFPNGETRRRTGAEIYKLLEADGISDDHFTGYKEHIRRMENPTAEEIAANKQERERVMKHMEKRKQEQEELDRITQKYKASSRIEKLHKKHGLNDSSNLYQTSS